MCMYEHTCAIALVGRSEDKLAGVCDLHHIGSYNQTWVRGLTAFY